MNVLILDKLYGERLAVAPKYYHEALKRRGHHVMVTRHLSDVISDSQELAKYDVAVAHPTFEDAKLLYDEVNRRSDFRVILSTGGILDMEKVPSLRKMIASKQVCYHYSPALDELVQAVEAGWS